MPKVSYFIGKQVMVIVSSLAQAALKRMCRGMRSVLLPDDFKAAEAAGAWERGRIALILGAWVVAGLLLCVRTFRWQRANGR